jgi:hypothetical protein
MKQLMISGRLTTEPTDSTQLKVEYGDEANDAAKLPRDNIITCNYMIISIHIYTVG